MQTNSGMPGEREWAIIVPAALAGRSTLVRPDAMSNRYTSPLHKDDSRLASMSPFRHSNLDLIMHWPVLPDYGCFLRWPENGHGFIHPDDVPTVTRLIPSPRVLKRISFDGVYYHYAYGRIRFRLRPAMWIAIRSEGIEIGDQVETVGLGLERDRFVATVWGMYYVQRKGCILYRLRRTDQVVPKLYSGDQLRVLTNKSTVRPPTTKYREPHWDGRGDPVPDTKLEE